MPVADSTASVRYRSGVRFEKEKLPVSVIIPTYITSACAAVILSAPHTASMSLHTRYEVLDASGCEKIMSNEDEGLRW